MKKVLSVLLSIILVFSVFAVSGIAEDAPECEHSFRHVVVPESCTVNGMEYDLCLKCRKSFNQTVIPKGHKFTHVVENSTCTAEGTEYDLCSACGEKANESVIPVKAHTWGKWVLTAEPTAAKEGAEERECTACHKKETRTVERLKTLSDEKSGISLVCGDSFGSDAELSVSSVNMGNFDIQQGSSFTSFDVSVLSGGMRAQPGGSVTLMLEKTKFSCGINSLTIYHFPEKGTNETFSTKRIDPDYQIFEQTIDGKAYFCITVSQV